MKGLRGSGKSGIRIRCLHCHGPCDCLICPNLIISEMFSYKKNVYGVLNDQTKRMDAKSITDMVEGERRRWRHADIEGDDALNILEFQVR